VTEQTGRDRADDGVSYTLTVNGRPYPVADAWLGESLLYVLRERCGLPAAKNACEQGECGSCSVRLDGVLVCACLVLAATATGRDVRTVEGLHADGAGPAADDGAGADVLSAVQQAFLDEGAVQCGFCTPGLVMAVEDLLAREPVPTDLQVREAISGNLCRCTGYGRILAAVHEAARRRDEARP
jgi:aerobic carbon-monoxide dehydrogenase small subunit